MAAFNPYLTINGVDVLPLIEAGGLKWTMNDIDAPNSGRTLDGKMHRGKVTSKVKLELTFLPMSLENAKIILTVLNYEYVTVVLNIDPLAGGYATYEMYNSTRPATLYTVDRKTGEYKWTGLTASLIER